MMFSDNFQLFFGSGLMSNTFHLQVPNVSFSDFHKAPTCLVF